MNDSSYESLTPEQQKEVDAITSKVPTWNVPAPYDELLHERLEELKKIDEELRMLACRMESTKDSMLVRDFRMMTLSVMIQRAEEAYRKF